MGRFDPYYFVITIRGCDSWNINGSFLKINLPGSNRRKITPLFVTGVTELNNGRPNLGIITTSVTTNCM